MIFFWNLKIPADCEAGIPCRGSIWREMDSPSRYWWKYIALFLFVGCNNCKLDGILVARFTLLQSVINHRGWSTSTARTLYWRWPVYSQRHEDWSSLWYDIVRLICVVSKAAAARARNDFTHIQNTISSFQNFWEETGQEMQDEPDEKQSESKFLICILIFKIIIQIILELPPTPTPPCFLQSATREGVILG